MRTPCRRKPVQHQPRPIFIYIKVSKESPVDQLAPITTSERLTEESTAQTNGHRLCLSLGGHVSLARLCGTGESGAYVVVKGSLAKLAADTALLVATEGQLPVEGVVGVDPDSTSLEGIADLDGGVKVAGVDGLKMISSETSIQVS